ncbi:GLPGLI family protein [Chryseobacterium hagamense]|uniref:GLPGLI family protein n=1 Tax=Chryseobacterium hagamense TaxID=395935 RepID=A0A511YRZ2_9FLAO|nr:GLPGLI family protein [Chryseobacterium hagamense]GEN77949.1 hypothetical protein CHA01nite_36890 [Chryseobacterium hagamense]
MKNILVIFLMLSSMLNAQGNKLKFSHKVLYDFYFVSDSLQNEKKNYEKMVLYFSDEYSIFQSNNKIKVDSLLSRIKNEDLKKRPFLKVNNVIYKNNLTKKVYFIENINTESLAYIDNYHDMRWEMVNETKMLLNVPCKKAITNYKGRKYIAWYSEKIPFSFGPYKFGGLPGLILELFDTKNNFKYTATEITATDINLVSNIDYKVINKDEFIKYKLDFLRSVYKPLIYNPIEL